MHARRAIVTAAAAALANLPTTGSRVYPGRSRPVTSEAAPHLLVYARQEQSGSDTMGGSSRKLMRQLVLSIEGIDTGATDDDAVVDSIAEEVEGALAADPTLGGTAKDFVITRTDITASTEDQERPVRTIVLQFSVFYRTAANDPTTAA